MTEVVPGYPAARHSPTRVRIAMTSSLETVVSMSIDSCAVLWSSGTGRSSSDRRRSGRGRTPALALPAASSSQCLSGSL